MSPFPPPGTIKNISDDGAVIPSSSPGRKSVLFFWASWHSDSSPGGEVDKVFAALSKQSSLSSRIDFYRVEAEAAPGLCQKVCVCEINKCCAYLPISFLDI